MPTRANTTGDIGNAKTASDSYDKDNIFLTDQGWVYRHYKSEDHSRYWDEIIVAGKVDPSAIIDGIPNAPVDSVGDRDDLPPAPPHNNPPLGYVPFAEPIQVSVGTNNYLLRGRTETASSNSQWGLAEEERGFVNTPWAANGDSAALASLNSQYAFLANPAYWDGTPPAGATYVLPGPEPGQNQGLLYYQGDGQLHYTRGTSNENQKILFYVGDSSNSVTFESGDGKKDIEYSPDYTP